MRQNNRGSSAAMWARIFLTAAICTLGLAQRSEAMAAYYSDVWMSSDLDNYDDFISIYGMGVVEADYGDYSDVATQSYLYGPSDDWVGCLDEDEYYAEADTTLDDTYYLIGLDDPYEYEVDSDHTGEGDMGPVDFGSSGAEVGVGSFVAHYNYLSQVESQYNYYMDQDSSANGCAFEHMVWSQQHIEGITYQGWYAGIWADVCVGKCYAGKSGAVTGPSGTPLLSIGACK